MPTIDGFDDDLLDEHMNWHMPGNDETRRCQPGNFPGPGGSTIPRQNCAGTEFLLFHRRFMWKVFDWFLDDRGAIPPTVSRWPSIPMDVRQQAGWSIYSALNGQLETNLPSFRSSDDLGNNIESPFPGLHGWVHEAAGQLYDEPSFVDVMKSPVSTLFYNWHGLINYWWKRWSLPIAGSPITGQAILFEHANFRGQHKHIITDEPNLNESNDSFFNDRVSSIVVLSGTWQLCRDSGFGQPYPYTLGRGLYPNVSVVGIPNDTVSSLRPVGGRPDLQYGTMLGHAILFEHADCRGQHKHVFAAEPDLNAPDDNFFNDRVSSLAVLSGRWAFFRDSRFGGQFPPLLGPGLYPSLPRLGIQDNEISSLLPVIQPYSQTGIPIQGHTILFEDRDFLGLHKHVLNLETDLGSAEDRYFNDRTSSVAVISGWWDFYRDSNFRDPDPTLLGPALRKYQYVEDAGIQNDRVSSLRVVQGTGAGGPVTPPNQVFQA